MSNDIYSPKHQLNAVQARIQFFYRAAFHQEELLAEVDRLNRLEEVLIREVDFDERLECRQ
jgi:hypothetical protein